MKNVLFIVLAFVFTIKVCYSQVPEPISVGFASVSSLDWKKILINVIRTDNINVTKYIYYRAEDNSNDYKEIGRSNSYSFTDINVDVNSRSYCYKVSYIDNNGKQAELSEPFCSIYLSNENANIIKWTPFSKLKDAEPVEYYVDIVNNNGSINRKTLFKTNELSATFNKIDRLEQEFDMYDEAKVRIRAIQPTSFKVAGIPYVNLPLEVYSNILTIKPAPSIFLPTAFTPNGDGMNDEFLAQGKGIVEFEMVIYDKWGGIIFESKDITQGWKGLQPDNDTPSMMGNYIYKVKAKNKHDKTIEKTGVVSLIR